MKIAFIGASHWHLPCYLKPAIALGHNCVLLDNNTESMKVKAEVIGCEYRNDIDDFLSEYFDFAFVFGRHDQMPEYIKMCINLAVPFMAEKPGALDPEVLEALAKLAEQKNVFNAAPFQMRLEAPPNKVKELIGSGRLGRVARIGMTWFAGPAQRYVNWKCPWVLNKELAGGGWLYNLGVHLTDLLYYWGFTAEYNSGMMSTNLNRGEVDDISTLVLDAGNDCYAVIEGGYCATAMYDGYSITIFAEKGNIEYSYGKMRITVDGEQEEYDMPMHDARAELVGMLLQRVSNGEKPDANLYDMLHAMKPVSEFHLKN
ncbi:MAG: Gfo/Idh/MocA family oxidoreductase [Victivallaceae bacterium]|nr:Gfo/Idh/MocA family oxidoreductase [Victivallaceae bacterium]